MKFAFFGVFAAAMALLGATQVGCSCGTSPGQPAPALSGGCRVDRLERQEINRILEPMWPVYRKMNCSRENIDAATTLSNGYTYFFKDDFYWRMYDAEVDPGYPRLIRQDWDGLPGHLDAALTWTDGRTFFFKGHQYWSFHGQNMDTGYPKNISEGFCGIPNNLDAAVLWKNNNKTYFFKGSHYWRFDGGESDVPVPSEYPLSISEWRSIPANVDAALSWRNGRTYFIKDGNYYRYNDHGNDNEAGRAVLLHGNWGLRCSRLNCRIPDVIADNTVV